MISLLTTAVAWLSLIASSGVDVPRAEPLTELEIAAADRATFPIERQASIYHLTTANCQTEAEHDWLGTALRLVIPSVSRERMLHNCSAVQLTPTLYRIDLDGLKWKREDWYKVLEAYPYSYAAQPTLIRADWLVLYITDAQESDAYYRLLYGRVPKTRDEVLKLLGVVNRADLTYGMVEGQSGVSKTGVREIANFPITRGYAYGTKDSLTLADDQDALAHPDGSQRHDGEEWIFGIWKTDLESGANGALQGYLLANGKGVVVNRAPVDLVEDHTRVRGLAEIRNGLSCFSCHPGLNLTTQNALRAAREAGVELYARYERQQQIEAFHFADLARQIKRDNEDFAMIVRKVCGCEPEQAARYFRLAVGVYDEPVGIDRLASEIAVNLQQPVDPQQLTLALGWASENGAELGPRLSGVVSGQKIPRDALESGAFLAARDIFVQWSALQ